MSIQASNYIPDIDLYGDAWVQLARASEEKVTLEHELEELLATIFVEVSSNPEFFQNGKPLSATAIKETFQILGHTPSSSERLKELKASISKLDEEILKLKGIIKTEEMKLAMFQTLSANSRGVFDFNGH